MPPAADTACRPFGAPPLSAADRDPLLGAALAAARVGAGSVPGLAPFCPAALPLCAMAAKKRHPLPPSPRLSEQMARLAAALALVALLAGPAGRRGAAGPQPQPHQGPRRDAPARVGRRRLARPDHGGRVQHARLRRQDRRLARDRPRPDQRVGGGAARLLARARWPTARPQLTKLSGAGMIQGAAAAAQTVAVAAVACSACSSGGCYPAKRLGSRAAAPLGALSPTPPPLAIAPSSPLAI